MKKAIIILYFIVIGLAGWLGYACYCDLSFDPDSSAGVIISSLGVMVTLLVAWQIYSTIEADRKIASIKNELTTHHHYVNARIHFTQGGALMQTTLSHISQAKSSKAPINPTYVGNLCVAYRNFLEALTHYLQSNKDIKAINSCVTNMDVCLNNLQRENVEFTKSIGNKCDLLYDTLLLMELLTSHKLQERLKVLNQKRTEITPNPAENK